MILDSGIFNLIFGTRRFTPMSNHYDAYRHGRETVIRLHHSSFRIRENGFGGLLGDLRIAEDVLRDHSDCSPEFRAGVESVVRECRLALRTYGRD